jgi:TolB-like protein
MSLFAELRRRNVFRVTIAYLAGSWLLIQVAETLLPVYGYGDDAVRIAVAVLAIGFVPVVLVSWLFQRTPGGLKKQSELDESDSTNNGNGGPDEEIVLAVLPFDNLSNDPEIQFFSDGVSEEIIQRLSRGASLKLIGRTSSFQFRDERKAKAAEVLKCTHVLDGSIRRAAARVRISAHLVEASSKTILWSDRYDRSLEDIFAVQDDISENIAGELHQAFSSFSSENIEPDVYDLYLRASLKSYAPEELRTNIGLLELATQRVPHFAEAWARLAYARAWLRFYEPFVQRASSASQVESDADRALALDSQNADALVAKLFVIAPFGHFNDSWEALEKIRQAPAMGDGGKYIGWFLRHFGFVQESVGEDERAYLTDPLDPMCANVVGLAKIAAGRLEEAVPVFEELVSRIPDMTFPFTNLLRAKALLEDWSGVDELLELAKERTLREFEDGLTFIRAKRHSAPANIDKWRTDFVVQTRETGCVDVSRLVYAAHLGLVDEAYEAAETGSLGPVGGGNDIMGPDGYRTSMLFQVRLPEIRQDPRFVRLCARLGLVEFWIATGKWPDCVDDVPYDFKAECEKASNNPIDDFGY